MPNKIYKYPLEFTPWQVLEMPRGSVIRFVGHQNNVITVWAEVTENSLFDYIPLYIFATGEEMKFAGGNPVYLNTVQFATGTVWHVYTATDGNY